MPIRSAKLISALKSFCFPRLYLSLSLALYLHVMHENIKDWEMFLSMNPWNQTSALTKDETEMLKNDTDEYHQSWPVATVIEAHFWQFIISSKWIEEDGEKIGTIFHTQRKSFFPSFRCKFAWATIQSHYQRQIFFLPDHFWVNIRTIFY